MFTDTDRRRYGIAIRVGTWYTITRYEWDGRPDVQCYDQAEYTSFDPESLNVPKPHPTEAPGRRAVQPSDAFVAPPAHGKLSSLTGQ